MADQPCPDCDGKGYQIHGEAACCGQAVNWECGGRGCTGPYETPVQFECEGCQGTGTDPSVSGGEK